MTFWQRLQSSVAGGALLIASASLASKVLGLLRDRLLFSRYGAGDTLDAYYAAFKLPDLIFSVLVLGALSSSFIPVFIQYWNKDGESGKAEAWRITNSLMNGMLLLITSLSLLLVLFAPLITPLLAPGFSGEKLELTTQLTRIMLLSIVFFGVSNIFSGVLNAFRRFAAFALAPVFYNVGILIGILLLTSFLGPSGLAWGVVLGAILHFAVQIPAVRHSGFTYQKVLDWRNPGFRKILQLMLPRTLGLGISQLNEVVITIIGSTLAVGSVSLFAAANNLQNFPIGLVGVSLAVAAFPYFSEAFSRQDHDQFVSHFSTTFRRILFLIMPAAVLMLLLRAHIVRVVLGGQAFTWEATYLAAQILGYFTVSLVAQSLIPMLARSYYADQDTKTPVKVAVATLLLNIALSLFLSPRFGILGLAFSYSASSVVNMLLLLAILRVRHGDLDDRVILRSTVKIVFASAVMGAVTWLTLRGILPGINNRTFVGIFLQGLTAGGVGVAVYLILALALRFDEVRILASWLKKFWWQLRLLTNGGTKNDIG
jgi:putative peptidoglycan lipid II flippase